MHRTTTSGVVRPALGALVLVAGLVVAVRALARTEEVVGAGERSPRRLLHIGDSHTAGIYGIELHRLLSEAGVAAETQASAGSSPSWWLDGTVTRYGFLALHTDGTSERADYQSPHATPHLREVLDSVRPEVLLVSLGANLRGSDAALVRRQVEQLAAVVLASEVGRAARCVWVGPPNTRRTAEAPDSDVAFYEALSAAVTDQGARFIDSRPLTPTYAGPDGLHFGGEQGTELAKRWAAAVFQQLRDLGV